MSCDREGAILVKIHVWTREKLVMQFRYILATLALLILASCTVAPVMAGTENITDNATSYFNIAQIAISTGDYAKAVQYFDMALADNTTMISKSDTLMYVYKDKTAALTDLGRYEEALATANTGLAKYPNSSGLWNNKGYALFKAGKYNEAVDAYNRAVTLEKDYVKGWINKGMALNAAGRYDEAITAFNTALTLDPENSDATTGLAAAQKGAASAIPVTTIILVVVVIVAAGIAVWYVKFRKPATNEKEPMDKKATKEKSKNKK